MTELEFRRQMREYEQQIAAHAKTLAVHPVELSEASDEARRLIYNLACDTFLASRGRTISDAFVERVQEKRLGLVEQLQDMAADRGWDSLSRKHFHALILTAWDIRWERLLETPDADWC